MSELVVRPGDHLLVVLPESATREQAAGLKDQLMERLPDLADVTVIAGATQLAVYREPELKPKSPPPPHRPSQMVPLRP